jgi:hypothetical protein
MGCSLCGGPALLEDGRVPRLLSADSLTEISEPQMPPGRLSRWRRLGFCAETSLSLRTAPKRSKAPRISRQI